MPYMPLMFLRDLQCKHSAPHRPCVWIKRFFVRDVRDGLQGDGLQGDGLQGDGLTGANIHVSPSSMLI
jgi:hypothetical protein